MAEHTPTPWIVDEDPLEDKGYKTLITMPGKNGFQGTSIAYVNHNWNDADHGERRISWGEAEANARHIVHCVNVHDDLVKALEEAIGILTCGEVDHMARKARLKGYSPTVRRLRDALARAKGGEG
jgi:hypothetical protein